MVITLQLTRQKSQVAKICTKKENDLSSCFSLCQAMEGQKIIYDCNQKDGPSLTMQTMHSCSMQIRLNTFRTSLSTYHSPKEKAKSTNNQNMVQIMVSQSLRTSDQSEIQTVHDQGVIHCQSESVFIEKDKFHRNLISIQVVSTHHITINQIEITSSQDLYKE